jgi:hypothetical protein
LSAGPSSCQWCWRWRFMFCFCLGTALLTQFAASSCVGAASSTCRYWQWGERVQHLGQGCLGFAAEEEEAPQEEALGSIDLQMQLRCLPSSQVGAGSHLMVLRLPCRAFVGVLVIGWSTRYDGRVCWSRLQQLVFT